MRTQDVFRAISDPTRREILRLLRERAMSAGELSERSGDFHVPPSRRDQTLLIVGNATAIAAQ